MARTEWRHELDEFVRRRDAGGWTRHKFVAEGVLTDSQARLYGMGGELPSNPSYDVVVQLRAAGLWPMAPGPAVEPGGVPDYPAEVARLADEVGLPPEYRREALRLAPRYMERGLEPLRWHFLATAEYLRSGQGASRLTAARRDAAKLSTLLSDFGWRGTGKATEPPVCAVLWDARAIEGVEPA